MSKTARVEAFSDAVFAIAITLLALELRVPRLSREPSSLELGYALLQNWPSYLAFVTSFASILIMWINHHAIFKLLRRVNNPFFFANGFLLMLVTAVPFPTALVAEFMDTGAAKAACLVYAGIFVLISLAYNALWWVATRHKDLLSPEADGALVATITRNYRWGLPLYLAAALAALWSPVLCLLICTGLWVFWTVTVRQD